MKKDRSVTVYINDKMWTLNYGRRRSGCWSTSVFDEFPNGANSREGSEFIFLLSREEKKDKL